MDTPIKFRTTTVTYLKNLHAKGGDQKGYLRKIIVDNISALEKSLEYCKTHHIGAFRVASTFFPAITHPDVQYTLEDFEDPGELFAGFKTCKQKAEEYDIRLTTHPSQFILLSSPNDDVTDKSISDLDYHAYLCDLMGGDVINIHVGGAYGDKEAAVARVKKNFEKLSPAVQSKLTLENDDKTYGALEVANICKDLEIPFVYDVHHHRCLKDSLSMEEATDLALKTWNREPLFHISSPLEGYKGKAPERHHDYINAQDFPEYWKTLDPLTVDIEAKAKELAIAKLQEDLALV